MSQMTFSKIESIIEDDINGILSSHQGFVVLAGVEDGPPIQVILEFHGQCVGCPSSFTFTLKFIERKLRKILKEKDLIVINVESL